MRRTTTATTTLRTHTLPWRAPGSTLSLLLRLLLLLQEGAVAVLSDSNEDAYDGHGTDNDSYDFEDSQRQQMQHGQSHQHQ